MNKFFKHSLSAVALGLVFASAAHADTLLLDRGLPSTNLNNAAGADRSNVAWSDGSAAPQQYVGDSFSLANNSQITSVNAWVVVKNASGLTAADLSSISLFGGTGSTLSAVGSAPSVVATSYPDGSQYQSTSGAFNTMLYELTFTVDWTVAGGATEFFALGGGPDADDWFVSATSTAALGNGASGTLNDYNDNGDGTLSYADTFDTNGNGWDKSSNLNVQLNGNQIPEPASLALLGVAALGAGLARRKARRKTS